MKTDTHTCVRGYTATVIASWHDDALAPADMERLRSHIPTCAACQSWLAECETLDSALRTQHVPEPSAHLWNDVRLGMERPRRRGRVARPTANFGRVARAALAVAAVALIVLSFARVLGSRADTQHPIAAATKPAGMPTPLPKLPPAAPPISGIQPSWQPASVPFNATDADALGIALSATDGNTGYICYAHPIPAGTQPAIWVTHDRGANWSLASHLPTQGKLDFAECDFSVDALVPSNLTAIVSAQNEDTLKSSVTAYISTDGGATWVLHSDVVQLDGLATFSGKSYAIWDTGTDFSNATTPHLAISADGLRTWQPIDSQFTARKLSVLRFWL
ncbi:MAG: hypothetical protein ACRDHP_16780, partial [Ktedonobacterales bacterium]